MLRKSILLLTFPALFTLLAAGGGGFGFFGPNSGPDSSFLNGISMAAFEQYRAIVTNASATKQQILDGLQNWASANQVTQYANLSAQEQQRVQQFDNAVAGNLTGQASQLFQQLLSITQNNQITRVAECQQLSAALNATNYDPVLRLLVPIPTSTVTGQPPNECIRQMAGGPFGGGMGPFGGGGRMMGRGGGGPMGRDDEDGGSGPAGGGIQMVVPNEMNQ